MLQRIRVELELLELPCGTLGRLRRLQQYQVQHVDRNHLVWRPNCVRPFYQEGWGKGKRLTVVHRGPQG
jgi:hypothetical protein